MGANAAAAAGDTIMGDPGVYLEKLSAFSRMLRLEGLSVSPKETADASQILIALGLEDRRQVRTALRTVFAKSREEQLNFDRVFDGFFISEEAMRQQAKEQMEREAQMEQARREAEQHFQLNGQSMEFDEGQMNAYASMPEEERQKLMNFMERYKESARRNPKLYGSFIHSVFAKALLEQQMRMEDAAVGCEAADPELGLMYRDISRFKDTELPKAISIIQTISRQINRRKRLVLLCDVSGSMVQFSEFALRFIQSLNQVSESSRVFLFSEDMFEADAFSLQNMDLFRNYVKQCGVYGRGTDLGTPLAKLCTMNPAVLNASTTLLILSDTKTIDQPRAIAAFLEAKRLAGKVIWLNPIPENHWPHIRSVQTFASVCPMVSCSTLHSLAAACRKLTQ